MLDSAGLFISDFVFSFSGVRSVLAVCQVSGGNNNIVLEIDFLLAMMLRVKHGSQSTYLFISYLVHT